MTELLTSAQMRAIERSAIESGAVSGLVLMERAGAAVAGAILARWPELRSLPAMAMVLCGPGNNGGDGFVISRLLAARGWQVAVHATGAASLAAGQFGAGDAAANARRWIEAGGTVAPLDEPALRASLAAATGPVVLVDALLGIGQTRNADGLLAPLLAALDACAPETLLRVAVDMPTGLCSDSGKSLASRPLAADLTVTFHAPKPCHYLADGPALCGTLSVQGIGLAADAGRGLRPVPARLIGPPQGLGKPAFAHKYSHGHVLVLAGGPGRGGAGRLAARAALRVGAGLVTLGCPPAALAENAARLDAVMLSPVADGAALSSLLTDRRISALCLGPGLGLDDTAAGLVAAALAAGRPTVLDADALSLIARDQGLARGLHPGCVLTPHAGEFARLFADIADDLAAPAPPGFSRLDAVRAAAARAGCTVLLKGPDTVIAAPDGSVRLHAAIGPDAVPWLATAGAGDVLAGFVAGLLARGRTPADAAAAAVWLHAAAARRFGPGLIAEDLAETLPGVLRDLGA